MVIHISDDRALFCLHSNEDYWITYLYKWSVNINTRLQTLNEAKSYTK